MPRMEELDEGNVGERVDNRVECETGMLGNQIAIAHPGAHSEK